MKYYPYIYCRTLNVDFRTICFPINNEIAKCKKNEIEDFVKQVINTDTASNGLINDIRYAFLYQQEFVLWGIGAANKMLLPNNYSRDCKDRTLRTFIGMLIPIDEFNSAITIPASITFFADIFNSIVVPVWNCSDNARSRQIINSTFEKYTTADVVIDLQTRTNINNDRNICAFFMLANKDNLLCSLKDCKTNIVTGLNVESHIFTANRFSIHFNNVVCADTNIEHIEKLLVENYENPSNNRQLNYFRDTIDVYEKDSNLYAKIKSKIRSKLKLKSDFRKSKELLAGKTESQLLPTGKFKYFSKSLDSEVCVNKSIINKDNTLMDWGSNWGDEDRRIDINTYPKQEEQEVKQASLMAKCDAALDAYKVQNKDSDEDMMQLRELLVKMRTEKKNLDEETINLIEKLINKL